MSIYEFYNEVTNNFNQQIKDALENGKTFNLIKSKQDKHLEKFIIESIINKHNDFILILKTRNCDEKTEHEILSLCEKNYPEIASKQGAITFFTCEGYCEGCPINNPNPNLYRERIKLLYGNQPTRFYQIVSQKTVGTRFLFMSLRDSKNRNPLKSAPIRLAVMIASTIGIFTNFLTMFEGHLFPTAIGIFTSGVSFLVLCISLLLLSLLFNQEGELKQIEFINVNKSNGKILSSVNLKVSAILSAFTLLTFILYFGTLIKGR